MRYRIPLVGNPSTDIALRDKYIAAFGAACYMSETSTFDCFYKEWQAACADAAKIGEVSGNAPYDQGYTCQPVGNGDYTLQVGPDVALKITINYQAAPRQTPLIEIDGVPTEVNGPYRNLTEPKTLGPGQPFNKCDSGMVNDEGEALTQTQWILQVNRKAHGGKIHSDLAGFKWPCKNEKCEPEVCEEPLVLPDPEDPVGTSPQVHHVVPMKDKRSWRVGHELEQERGGDLCTAQPVFHEQRPAGGRGEAAQQRDGVHAVTRLAHTCGEHVACETNVP